MPPASRCSWGRRSTGTAACEADLEILLLALDCLKAAQVSGLSVDLADASVVDALLAGVSVSAPVLAELHAALATKDSTELASLSRGLPATTREGLLALAQLYGDEKVLDEARVALKSAPGIDQALSNLKWLASQLGDARVTFDLADLRGYAYYSGPRFSVYASGAGDALVRGGRYDGWAQSSDTTTTGPVRLSVSALTSRMWSVRPHRAP
jgi:ATP phosphoribosyltransferase regulatory subunit